ncbi:MAG: DUF5011 domain-containing protein [Bacteroidetes bacterium]|nr:DUF5011 domain-containing protein [Bacteroidota bacterium]
MKKQFLNAAAIVLAVGTLSLVGCKKDNTTPPAISLTGSSLVTVNLGATYTDAGATATDSKNDNITSSIVTTGLPINTNQCGSYVVTYNVTDKSGNAAPAVTRTVQVSATPIAGTYSVSPDSVSGGSSANNGVWNYNVVVTASSTIYNGIILTNFAGLGSTTSVSATINGTAVTIPTQTVSAGGGVIAIAGTGTYSVNPSASLPGAVAGITNIVYTTTTGTATSVYGNGKATYIKQ